jgi:hypothetical protein
LSLIKAKEFINGLQGQVEVFLGVSVTDIAVVEGREKEAFADQLGVEIRAFGFVCAGVIALKGDVEHGRDAGQFSAHIVFVDEGLDAVHESFSLFPDVFQDLLLNHGIYNISYFCVFRGSFFPRTSIFPVTAELMSAVR